MSNLLLWYSAYGQLCHSTQALLLATFEPGCDLYVHMLRNGCRAQTHLLPAAAAMLRQVCWWARLPACRTPVVLVAHPPWCLSHPHGACRTPMVLAAVRLLTLSK